MIKIDLKDFEELEKSILELEKDDLNWSSDLLSTKKDNEKSFIEIIKIVEKYLFSQSNLIYWDDVDFVWNEIVLVKLEDYKTWNIELKYISKDNKWRSLEQIKKDCEYFFINNNSPKQWKIEIDETWDLTSFDLMVYLWKDIYLFLNNTVTSISDLKSISDEKWESVELLTKKVISLIEKSFREAYEEAVLNSFFKSSNTSFITNNFY